MSATTTSALPAIDEATNDVRVFDSAESPADPVALATLQAGIAGIDLAAPAVVLPDFHHKDDKEMPSSIAVATRQTIRPTMGCTSLNCGMALVALDIDRPSAERIADFYDRVRVRMPHPPTYRPGLTAEDVVRCAAEGARFAVERFGVDPAALQRIEESGCLDTEPYGGIDRVRDELPWSVKQLSRIRWAKIGPSNHFIELQAVEEVFDPDAAALLGVSAGQITMQYHGGGGSLPGELGVLFGRRKRFPRALRLQMAVQKPLYHLASARSPREFALRRRLYFSGGCPPVERDSSEGERLMLSNVMAMNYGFAFRATVFAILSELLHESMGVQDSRLIVDSPHNTAYEEEVEGKRAIVHRHNAARALPASRMTGHPLFGDTGQPLLLPGTNRTSSYLCFAGEGAVDSLYSVSHGAGSGVTRFEKCGLSGRDPEGRRTLRFSYERRAPEAVEQLDDRGVNDTLHTLAAHDIVRPVARLRPFAVLN